MNEGANTSVLVRSEGVSDRPAVSLPLRAEQVPEASEDGRDSKRRYARREAMAKWRNNPENRERERTYRERIKEQLAQKLRAWREANPEKYREQGRKAYAKALGKYGREELNRRQLARIRSDWQNYLAKASAWQKARRKNNPDPLRAWGVEYRRKNHAEIIKRSREGAAMLAPGYVRRLLANSTGISGSLWPDTFVQTYTVNLKIKRQLKLWQNQKTSPNCGTNSLTHLNPSNSIPAEQIK